MTSSFFDAHYETFEHIFKNKVLLFYKSFYYGHVDDLEITWYDLKIKAFVENNENLSNFLLEMFDVAIACTGYQGECYAIEPVVNNNEFGFSIDSWYSSAHFRDNGMEPEGIANSIDFFSDKFISKLNIYPIFQSINKNNLSDFINFKIVEGGSYYFKFYDPEMAEWINHDQFEIGEEIEKVIFDLFYDEIYCKDEFNVVSDDITFDDKCITFYSTEQTEALDREYVSLSSVFEKMN
jgi:hypothetical protein